MWRKDIRYITNMIEAIENVFEIMSHHENEDFEQFLANIEYNSAVVLNVGQIGEQLKSTKMSANVYEKFPEIECSKIAGMRQVLYHDYFEVDYEILWHTIRSDLSPLLNKLHHVQEKMKKEMML
jgi:uncharacterized protein with HEPN domain